MLDVIQFLEGAVIMSDIMHGLYFFTWLASWQPRWPLECNGMRMTITVEVWMCELITFNGKWRERFERSFAAKVAVFSRSWQLLTQMLTTSLFSMMKLAQASSTDTILVIADNSGERSSGVDSNNEQRARPNMKLSLWKSCFSVCRKNWNNSGYLLGRRGCNLYSNTRQPQHMYQVMPIMPRLAIV